MSFVVLQIGQCGNQFGCEFFSTIIESVEQTLQNLDNANFSDEVKRRFFCESKTCNQLFARAVLIDTEPKVIKDAMSSARKHRSWGYHNDSCYVQREGAANNWAMGYFKHGPLAREKILDLVHREAERCDYLNGFLSFMSVAGGTGSGLGTYLTEVLKEEFPSCILMNQVTWPFSKGEVTVQAYNAVLSLSHLQSSADAIMIFENDQLLKLCMQRMGIKDVSLEHLNNVASRQLATLLLPCNNPSGVTPMFGDILAHLVPHPQFKLMGLRSVPQEPVEALPFSFYTWQGLLRTLRRMVLYNSHVDEISSKPGSCTETSVSLANLLILRGLDAKNADSMVLHKPSLPYVSWVPPTLRLKTWTHPLSLFGHEKTATLASNGQFLTHCVDEAIAKAWKMYNFKAYVHHYKRYGLSDDDFIESFARAEQVVANYNSLSTNATQ